MSKLNLKDANRLFLDGSLALARVERAGIRVDTDLLSLTTEKVDRRIKKMVSKMRESKEYEAWRRMAGGRVDLGSREQWGRLLFDHMKLPYEGELTKTKRYKTEDSVLSALHHPFVDRLLRLEKLKKLKGTYLNGIAREVVNGLLHPFYHLNTVLSMRGSCSDPNFQNIPIRDPAIGEMIRSCFIPRKGRVLVEIDYGALEWKIACMFWKDKRMLEYARDKSKDIHRDMAMRCYLLDENQWNKNSRFYAKNQFTFPKLYGSFWAKMARHLWDAVTEGKLIVGTDGASLHDHLKSKGIRGLGRCDDKSGPQAGHYDAHIKKVEDWFDSYFSGLTDAKKRWIADYRNRGWFEMPTGFRCHGIYSNNQLLNFPIQGSGFHCLLLSLILMQKEIRKRKMKSLIVGEIHDCILADVPLGELQDFLTIIKDIMTVEIAKRWDWVIAPLEAEVDVTPVGGNWHQKAPWIEHNGIWGPKAA